MTWALFAIVACNTSSDFGEPPNVATFDESTEWGSWLSAEAAPDGRRIAAAWYSPYDTAVGFSVGTPGTDDAIAWVHEHVDGWPSGGVDLTDVGKYASLGIDAEGKAWIAYQDATAGGLKVAQRTSPGEWKVEAVDPTGGRYASLAFSTDGRPVVAHVDDDAATVRLSRTDGEGWETTIVASGAGSTTVTASGATAPVPARVAYTRILVAGGVEFVAWQDAANGTLHLLEGGPAGFTDEIVDSEGLPGVTPTMTLYEGTLHIAYLDAEANVLRLATRSGSGFDISTIDDGKRRGADVEMYWRDGKPRFVYQDAYASDLLHAAEVNGNYDPILLNGEQGAAGFHNEVVTVADGTFIGTYDATARKPVWLKAPP